MAATSYTEFWILLCTNWFRGYWDPFDWIHTRIDLLHNQFHTQYKGQSATFGYRRNIQSLGFDMHLSTPVRTKFRKLRDMNRYRYPTPEPSEDFVMSCNSVQSWQILSQNRGDEYNNSTKFSTVRSLYWNLYVLAAITANSVRFGVENFTRQKSDAPATRTAPQ